MNLKLVLTIIWFDKLGCLNGGGQIKPKPGQSGKDLLKLLETVYMENVSGEDNCGFLVFAILCFQYFLLPCYTSENIYCQSWSLNERLWSASTVLVKLRNDLAAIMQSNKMTLQILWWWELTCSMLDYFEKFLNKFEPQVALSLRYFDSQNSGGCSSDSPRNTHCFHTYIFSK